MLAVGTGEGAPSYLPYRLGVELLECGIDAEAVLRKVRPTEGRPCPAG